MNCRSRLTPGLFLCPKPICRSTFLSTFTAWTTITIAHNFTLLSKLMDIHGENSFKTKSYANAAFTIDKLPAELSGLPLEKIQSIKGIGDAIAQKIMVQLQTGELPLLNEYIEKTPPGIIEMLADKRARCEKNCRNLERTRRGKYWRTAVCLHRKQADAVQRLWRKNTAKHKRIH